MLSHGSLGSAADSLRRRCCGAWSRFLPVSWFPAAAVWQSSPRPPSLRSAQAPQDAVAMEPQATASEARALPAAELRCVPAARSRSTAAVGLVSLQPPPSLELVSAEPPAAEAGFLEVAPAQGRSPQVWPPAAAVEPRASPLPAALSQQPPQPGQSQQPPQPQPPRADCRRVVRRPQVPVLAPLRQAPLAWPPWDGWQGGRLAA